MENRENSLHSLSALIEKMQQSLDAGDLSGSKAVAAEIKQLISFGKVPDLTSDSRSAVSPVGKEPDRDFWELNLKKEKKYSKPDFDSPPGSYDIRITGEEDISGSDKSEPIPERESVQGTSSHKKVPGHSFVPSEKEEAVVRKYSFIQEGLLSSVIIRSKPVDSLYSHFSRDVAQSHRSSPEAPFDSLSPVPFQSYIPQFSHMSSQQIEFYRAWREEVRNGSYPACDLSYIILYIYEIINLPDLITPQKGVRILTSLWIAYRRAYPRIDSFLSEWMADYCLIHETPLPKGLLPFIPQIAPKSQFKEFYLHPLVLLARDGEKNNVSLLGKAVIETLSDYDYTQSKCYKPNKAFYDSELPYLLGMFITKALSGSVAPLSLDRFYSLTRESYSGAVVAPGIKMRIDLSFLSFTRKAESRQVITSALKECENRLRYVLGIKSKLKTDPLTAETGGCLTEALNSVYPPPNAAKNEEPEYMEYYEPDSAGYDYDSAAELEYSSWANTERLTGEDLIPREPENDDAEISVSSVAPASGYNSETENSVENTPADSRNTDPVTKGAVRAALDGEFGLFCRENKLNEGNTADIINSLFLEVLGDVIIEPEVSGTSYRLVEDYRKEIENWLQTY